MTTFKTCTSDVPVTKLFMMKGDELEIVLPSECQYGGHKMNEKRQNFLLMSAVQVIIDDCSSQTASWEALEEMKAKLSVAGWTEDEIATFFPSAIFSTRDKE